MLQRIQSVFLALALVLLGLIFVLPFATMVDAQGNEHVVLGTQFPTVIIQIITFGITFITIFLYKNRRLQIRLSMFNFILLIAYQAFLIWHVYRLSKLADATQLKVAMIIPIVVAILTLLALRRIAKDEALVKSLDRLR